MKAHFIFAGVFFLLLGGTTAVATSTERAAPPDETSPSTSVLGISPQKYTVEKGRVSRYQTLADLLTSHGVSYRKAVRLAESVRPAFDVRNIKSGHSYRVFMNPWLQRAQYLVYRASPVESVVFNAQDPSKSHVVRRPVGRTWTTVKGTIEESLYETITSNGAHPKLALRLSEVFAWQIDFFRIQPGDSFRILYEQRKVDGETVAPGKIVAASFEHQDQQYFGVRFDDGNGAQYFNREGGSLRRELLKAPLRYSRISSGFSHSRMHPVLNRRRPHHGTDYAAPTGTPVHAVGGGTVVKAGHYGPNGNYIKIRHNEIYSSGYLHLSDFADGLHRGAEVSQGETIGYVGDTGRSTGPHLDYRLWKHGTAVDPYAIELPPSRPVSPQHRETFQQIVQDRLNRLFPLRTFDRRVAAGPRPSPVVSKAL
ncbi:MAG: peptidase M24 [Bacteroidetes bacterium SW_9_63_38]|nr:MAG: peptidase M24 [Bacteroidetes bacterium SW_9_63_38]